MARYKTLSTNLEYTRTNNNLLLCRTEICHGIQGIWFGSYRHGTRPAQMLGLKPN